MADVLKIDRIRLKALALLISTSPTYALPEPNVTVYMTSNSTDGIHFQWLVPLEGIQSKLLWTFSFHVYFFGCTFFVLAVYTFSSVLNIRSQISRKRFMSGINTFLCIFGISRAISLCVDPYGTIKILPVPITNAVWAIGFPSLTSSFCLLQLAFLHLTKLKIGAKLLRIEILLRSVITLHIFSSVLRAVISSLHWSTNIVVINYICELVFLSWALFLHASFLYIGYKVFELLNRVPATMLQPNGCQNKGIMQLVMLAPASNLVTSVTAALMPTLLGPAASMTANKMTAPGATTAAAENEKSERIIKANSSSSSATTRLGQLKGKQKTFDDLKLPDDTITTKGAIQPAKTKKLTWQASITNENQTEPALISSKILGPTAGSNTKRPILKDASKPVTGPKFEPISQVTDNKGQQLLQSNEVANADAGCDKTSARENDILLHTILNHIAYVNRASGSSESGFAHCSHDATPTSRKKQVRFVLKITYATAILGFSLTLAEFFQRFGPYGLLQYYMATKEVQPWPWFIFQTFCRSCELLMSSAIANITKQSAANVHRYYKHNPVIMKQRGSMFM